MITDYQDIKLTVEKPLPIDREVVWDKSEIIVSETDIYGRIVEVNDAFCDVSGYSIIEMIGQPHSIVRHPDMPQIIFKMLWDNLKSESNFVGVIKNLAKSGEYYWVIADFIIRKDVLGNVTNYIARRKSVSKDVVDNHIAPLYETLLRLEKVGGMELSSRFLKNYLDKEGKNYISFVVDLVTKNKQHLSFEEVPAVSFEINKNILNDTYTLNDEIEEKRKSFLERLYP
ncbi:PAS domain-containing protein [Capnocytophaga stomatis]|uniref:PAS domain-containing protein n=1 Tax=Capnocytophaga stomatis TaxID=1848904 RepID=A0ABW8QDE8_9FLAO|nr:PAS domain-containing protein [Capnocytophaga stomatis]GIJ95089.1 methyl-accepting chemotaxis protein [Capnocytophaga stomatis]GIJ95626.1 methyl-accepting chemotaxis protein [Capnocytophaga stomatis]